MNNLRKKIVWTGKYKGVLFEIVQWNLEQKYPYDKPIWNYYIFLNLEKIKSEYPQNFWLEPKQYEYFTGYGYLDFAHFNNIFFHGGMTFYEKHMGFEPNEPKIIKIGCDYNHLFDQDQDYELDDIYNDVKRTIESLYFYSLED